jgi:hypothetical protein
MLPAASSQCCPPNTRLCPFKGFVFCNLRLSYLCHFLSCFGRARMAFFLCHATINISTTVHTALRFVALILLPVCCVREVSSAVHSCDSALPLQPRFIKGDSRHETPNKGGAQGPDLRVQTLGPYRC